MKRFLSLFLVFIVALSLCACASRGGKAPQETAQDGGMSDEEAAPIFSAEEIALPEVGVSAYFSQRAGDSIFLLCRDEENRKSAYRFTPDNCAYTQIAMDGWEDLRPETADGLRSGEMLLSELDSEGNLRLVKITADNHSSVTTLSLPEELSQEFIMDIRLLGDSYLVQTISDIYILDAGGAAPRELGGPYNGVPRLVRDAEDRLFIVSAAERGYKLQKLSPGGDSIEAAYPFTKNYTSFYDGGQDGTILAELSGTVFCVSYAEGEALPLVNLQVTGDLGSGFVWLDNGQYFSLRDGTPTRWSRSGVGEITVLKLATFRQEHEDSIISEVAAKYNSLGAPYRIEIVDYGAYNEDGNSEAGMNRFRTDIIAGNTPDIYDLWYMPSLNYDKQGLVENLYPYFEADEELSVQDLVPSVVAALEKNGGLYDFTPTFYLTTTFCPKGIYEQSEAWDFAAMRALAERRGAEQVIPRTRDAFLQYLLSFTGDALIDYTSAVCHFDSEDFLNALHFASGLESEWANISYGSVYEGKQLTLTQSFDDPIKMWRYADGLFHGEAVVAGFPGCGGAKFIASPNVWLGMSANSEKKDGVWQFFKYLLSDSAQSQMDGLPIKASRLSATLDTQLSLGQTEKRLGLFVNDAEFTLELAPVPEAVRREADGWIGQISGFSVYDAAVYAIVHEEAEKYFAGQVSAEKAAESIQSRVSIYLSEQYG